MLIHWSAVVITVLLALVSGARQDSPEATVRRVVADARFAAAMAALDGDHDRLIAETIALTEIPAPPFAEERRADAYLDYLRRAGLTDVERDDIGNVMGIRRGVGGPGGPVVAVVAHLDTVFPEGTDVRVTRSGTRLSAPGVGDNTRSAAVLLALVRAMDAAKLQTRLDMLFVGNVGEEGLGDLRGVKYLMQKGKYRDRIRQFIAVDSVGNGDDIVHGAVGSRRFRVTFRGPGGHSYSAFGQVNPAFAMGAAMAKLGAIAVPASPKTTFNVGVVGGGTSVNSIPFETWMEVDIRSEAPVELERVEVAFRRLVAQAVQEENAARRTDDGQIAADITTIGNRPSGQTPRTSAIVRAAAEAVRSAGLDPQFGFSSTDANLPISLGIPAIRLNSGATGDRVHALDEWIDVEKTASLRGMRVLLATLLAVADLQ